MDIEPAPVPSPNPRLDAVILQCVASEWCKVAMLIARTTDAARAQSIEVTAQDIAGRIYALAASGQIETQGNVRRWRAAEVRRHKSA